ncbi:unnamed protein product [Mycena citricolor]|uniref:Uncharacterized protein n=1 Tax=Mycena citricolor TaxID=2018698 RepID=A0AAD2HLR7_9AGAR|nr:unnamed protein product [Mycena citricolor]
MATGMLAGLVFGAFKVFGPKQTGRPKRKPAPVSAPVTVTATGAGGYQEEWIPEHHIRKPKAVRTKSKTAASGDEFSEMSASEISEKEGSKKTKGKGRK